MQGSQKNSVKLYIVRRSVETLSIIIAERGLEIHEDKVLTSVLELNDMAAANPLRCRRLVSPTFWPSAVAERLMLYESPIG